jgi:acyl-CoA thioesterase FadM
MIPSQDYVEALVARRPITVRRRVLWSECDPAQVVYTARFVDYMSAAYNWFCREVINTSDRKLSDVGLGMPMKGLSLEFHRMLWPDDWFEMVVQVTDIRTRTFDTRVNATTLDGLKVFTGRMSPIFINDRTKEGVLIPDYARELLEEYQSEQLG